ncbi:MAG: DUF3810 domain-containing protein [Ruminococcaceae bacterium]|nr:DUF3810 domain-containing protein [Oscillospiraceae bacterium]
MTKIFGKINKYIPTASIVIAFLGIISLGINIAYSLSADFADFFNTNISANIRVVTAALTSWIPFSLAEFLVISSPVLVVALITFCVKKVCKGTRDFIRCIAGLLSILILLYSMFVFTFGAGYKTPTLDKKMGLLRSKVSAVDLYETMTIVVDELNSLADEIIYIEGKGSVRPYSHNETTRRCIESYKELSDEYTFLKKVNAPVKQIVLSEYMTYTHISGVYTFFTGEANLNTNYPYFVNVYTMAHEMAHQRGIARENEANFIAYLVCINSTDPYMQYSGYLNMYEYLANPLYSASKELYSEAVGKLDSRVRYDLKCYSEFFDKYRENIAADVSDTVNDTYLKVQGTVEGSKSYGMVVDLAVAYHKNAESAN